METRYVALLRGINIGGHRVRMDRLRQVFVELGLGNVRSYINSGNVFFDTVVADRVTLAQTIERGLLETLGYEVPVFLRTPAELAAIIDGDPYGGLELTDDLRFAVVFTDVPMDTGLSLPLSTAKSDMDLVAVRGNEAFVVWRIIGGRPPSGTFPRDLVPARNTTRFFHTVKKILAAATS